MACERKARFRRNTIAFWLSDEEKNREAMEELIQILTALLKEWGKDKES